MIKLNYQLIENLIELKLEFQFTNLDRINIFDSNNKVRFNSLKK